MSAEWITPKPFIFAAKQVLGEIDLDPASSDFAQRNVQAGTYYTERDDGLTQPWFGRVWLSPPNGRGAAAAFAHKLVEDFCAGRVTEAIVLVPNSTDTEWYHRLAGLHMPVLLKAGRIRFESPTRKSTMPANGQSFFYFGGNITGFKAVFGTMGHIWGGISADCKSMAEICANDRRVLAETRAAREQFARAA